MKIGCIVIHTPNFDRKQNVDNLQKFFLNTDVDFRIINGVITNKILYDARFKENKSLTKGQIGCAIAHLNAYKTAIDNDYDYVFIFEDDVKIRVNSYSDLKNWINSLSDNFDICLLTNVGTYQGIGHDGRNHVNKKVNDVQYVTCPFGTQCYYANKKIIKLLYDTQINMMNINKIHIADGLIIHCEKNKHTFLNIVTPINVNRFFQHIGFNESIVNKFK